MLAYLVHIVVDVLINKPNLLSNDLSNWDAKVTPQTNQTQEVTRALPAKSFFYTICSTLIVRRKPIGLGLTHTEHFKNGSL